MNTKLKHIQDWSGLAKRADWSVAKLAALCNISVDTLRRYFFVTMGTSPRQWLAADRQREALKLLNGGCSIKVTAAALGYRQQTNFTRKFKGYWGICPSKPPNQIIAPWLREND